MVDYDSGSPLDSIKADIRSMSTIFLTPLPNHSKVFSAVSLVFLVVSLFIVSRHSKAAKIRANHT